MASTRFRFVASIAAGALLYAALGWAGAHGGLADWAGMAGLGFYFAYYGKGNPLLWPLGLLLGQILAGFALHFMHLFFYRGGGASFFWPIGVVFLFYSAVPALIGSLIGALLARRRQLSH